MSDRARLDGHSQPLSYIPGTKLQPPRYASSNIEPLKPLLRYIFKKKRPSIIPSYYPPRSLRRVNHLSALAIKAKSSTLHARKAEAPVQPERQHRAGLNQSVGHPDHRPHHANIDPPLTKPPDLGPFPSRQLTTRPPKNLAHKQVDPASSRPNHPSEHTQRQPAQARRPAMPHIETIPSDDANALWEAVLADRRKRARQQQAKRNRDADARRARGEGERENAAKDMAEQRAKEDAKDMEKMKRYHEKQEAGLLREAYDGRKGHNKVPKEPGPTQTIPPDERIDSWLYWGSRGLKRPGAENSRTKPPAPVHHREPRNRILLDDDPVVRLAAMAPLAPIDPNSLPTHTSPEPEGPCLPYWTESVYHALYGLTINVGNLIGTFAASILTFILGIFHCIATGVLIILAALADGLTTLLRMFFNMVTCHFGSGDWTWEWRHLTHVWKWGRKSTWVSDFVQHVSLGTVAERDSRTAKRNSIHEARKEEYKREQAGRGNDGQAVEVPEMKHGRYSLGPQDLEKGMRPPV